MVVNNTKPVEQLTLSSSLEAGGGQGTVAVVHIHYSLVALWEGAFLIVCVKLGAYLLSDMTTRISENYQHSFHKSHAFYQHLARPENDQSLFALCTKTHPRLSLPLLPHRDIQGSGPLVYFLRMNVIDISMFMLKPKGMYIMNEFFGLSK